MRTSLNVSDQGLHCRHDPFQIFRVNMVFRQSIDGWGHKDMSKMANPTVWVYTYYNKKYGISSGSALFPFISHIQQ